MSLPREPRQKMINMMYLVLTALLALNVSSEILNAFKTVNKSLEVSTSTVGNSTEQIMTSLIDKQSDPKTAVKASIWLPKAEAVRRYTATVYKFIQDIKDDIIKQGGGDVNKANFKADNLDIATRLMVEGKKGQQLKLQLDQFKKDVLKAVLDNSNFPDSINVDTIGYASLGRSLPINTETPSTVSKSNRTFERAYFHMVPTVAALTILSKFQNDIRTSENKIVDWCHNKVGAVVVRFDTYTAFAATNSSYIMPGDEMEITAGVGAFSKAALPEITINGSPEKITEDGAAHRKMNASAAIGDHTITVNIKYKDQDGVDQVAVKQIKYTVGQSAASIALDKMNVLYIGVDNPVTVAASGAGDDKIGFSITGGGGTYTKTGGGRYTVRVNSVTDECWINVTVDNKVAGKSKFRVRTIPKPIAVVGGYESGANVPAGGFRAQSGVGAFVKDFPFELQYKVTKFTLSADTDDGYIDDAACTGNTWSSEAQRILNSLKPGRTIMIDDINAVGPDGRNQKLPSLVYYIK